MELGPTTQRLGIFGFAQSNVIYDFYQKEPIVWAPRRPIHRRSVAGPVRAWPADAAQPAPNAVERDVQVRWPSTDPREDAP